MFLGLGSTLDSVPKRVFRACGDVNIALVCAIPAVSFPRTAEQLHDPKKRCSCFNKLHTGPMLTVLCIPKGL